MPHFGNDLASPHRQAHRGMEDSALSSDARGADLLLSLADRATEHGNSLSTPAKGFYPLSKPVTPEDEEVRDSSRAPMLMSIHSSANHRILPSPIKLQDYSLVYSTGSSESSSPNELAKREAELPPSGESPRKQARSEDEDEASHPEAHRHEDEHEIEATGSSLISPSSSDECKKNGHPPESSVYYGHHPQHPHPHYAQYQYPPATPSAQYPPTTPSWGHHAPPPPPHMMAASYYHYPPPPQYYSMVPPRTPNAYGHPMSQPPIAPPPAKKSNTNSRSFLPPSNDANAKETSMSSKHAEAQAEAIKSIADWQKGVSGAPQAYARCIPLSHPIPSRYWGETNKDVDRKLPDFPRLVNFPDYLSRGQTRSGDGANSTVEGKRHCVMCGQLRVCSKTANRANQKSVTTSNASSDKDTDSTAHIIPRQNKGVCTACDVAVWVMVSQDGLEIKWCKGCKNFRPWAAFGEKGLATKCVRCRHRQREKYASQKNELRRQQESYLEKKDDDILAARSLSNLMSARDA